MSRTEPVEMFVDSQAVLDVIAERERQQTEEGWTTTHDDGHPNGEMARAAGCYALHAHNQQLVPPRKWPWSHRYWKPKGPRRDLVRSAALIIAEIERLDRLASTRG